LRGGKRPGAGRKTTLSRREIWAIGAEYNRLLDEAADKPTRKRPLHDLDAIREARRRANSISVPESNKALEGLGAFEAGDDVAEIPLIDISGDSTLKGAS